jgi:flavin reductase (DIM6/NTAB) family NADH-FMN oxidoreductase RutF
VGWRKASGGSPVLDGVLAWIDCSIADVVEEGDHYIVVGRVNDLEVMHEGGPLLFFRGGYGRFQL